MIYWDTSAILKLYAPEMDSAYFLRLATRAEEQVVTSSPRKPERSLQPTRGCGNWHLAQALKYCPTENS